MASQKTKTKPAPPAAAGPVNPDLDPADVEEAIAFSALLQDFGRLLTGEYDRRVPIGRGPSLIISLLMERDGRTQTELAEEMNMHKVSVGAHVDTLVRRNLVERRPHPSDRRSKQVWLTPHFETVRAFGQRVFTMIHGHAIQGVSEADYRKAVKVLTAMRDNLRRLKDETGG